MIKFSKEKVKLLHQLLAEATGGNAKRRPSITYGSRVVNSERTSVM